MLRRRFLPLCVAAVTILLAVPALADFTGKVVAVADGDTIAGAAKLSVSDKPLNVR
jgi:hypothetical protein